MSHYVNSMEITLDNLEFAQELNISENYIDLMRSSGGLSCDSRFYVLYTQENIREDPEVQGYMTVLTDKDGETNLSLYKSVKDVEMDYMSEDTAIHRMGKSKAAIHNTYENEKPMTVFQTDNQVVYLPKSNTTITEDINKIGFSQIETDYTFLDQVAMLGGDVDYAERLGDFFGVENDDELYALEQHDESLWDVLPEFWDLMKRDPEYRRLTIGNYLGGVAEGLLEGTLTGLLFDAATLYGLASVTGYATKFTPKIMRMATAAMWGKAVDDAADDVDALEKLRGVERFREVVLSNTHAAAFVGMQKPILDGLLIGTLGIPPEAAFLGLLGVEELSGGIKDAGSQKTMVAIREELLSHYEEEGYDKKLFQLIGLEESMEGALHMGSFVGGMILAYTAKAMIWPVSLAGLGTYFLGKSLWTCHSHQNEITIDMMSNDYVPTEEGFKFDNGYVLDFEKVSENNELTPLDKELNIGHLRQLGSCYIVADHMDGDWGVAIKAPEEVEVDHNRRLSDYRPLRWLASNKSLKESWKLGSDMLISKYAKSSDYAYEDLEDGTILFGTETYRDKYKQRKQKEETVEPEPKPEPCLANLVKREPKPEYAKKLEEAFPEDFGQ